MFYLIPANDNHAVSSTKPSSGMYYEVESLPEGYGRLLMADDGSFYYAPFPEPEPVVPPEPPKPIPEPSVVELIQNLQDTNLFLMMSLADIYSELMSLKGGE